MIAYLLHGHHDRRRGWGLDFVRLAIPRNGTALVNLLAIGVDAADSPLHFIPHRLESDRHLFQFGAGREFRFGRVEFAVPEKWLSAANRAAESKQRAVAC